MVQILRYPCLFLLVFVSRGVCLDSQGVLVKGVAVLFLPRVFFNSYPKVCLDSDGVLVTSQRPSWCFIGLSYVFLVQI